MQSCSYGITFLNGYTYQIWSAQGSVLGPLLYLLYVDELHRIIQHNNITLFPDDIALQKEIVSPIKVTFIDVGQSQKP